MPQIGIMLEVPSMLYLLPLIADKIDFVSVGTNDLTQYLLAVDRNNARVADVYESMHPAVVMALKQIQQTCATIKYRVCLWRVGGRSDWCFAVDRVRLHHLKYEHV